MGSRKSGEPGLKRPEALASVRSYENAWNLGDLDAIVLRHTIDCHWRCRGEFMWGREQVRTYLARTRRLHMDYRVVCELWAVEDARIALRFACEFHDDGGVWRRGFGNETWECDRDGLVRRRMTSLNEHAILEHERTLRWPGTSPPADYPSLSELGL